MRTIATIFETILGAICVLYGAISFQWSPIVAGIGIFIFVAIEIVWRDLRSRQLETLKALEYIAWKT
jgi:hypothetical protein